jgi:nucleoid DNA-binding protein
MKKTDLIFELSESSTLSKVEVKVCVDTILTALTKGIVSGEDSSKSNNSYRNKTQKSVFFNL